MMMNPASRMTKPEKALYIATFLLVLAYYLALCPHQSLWIDECWAADLRSHDIFPKLFQYSQYRSLPPWGQNAVSNIYSWGGSAQIILRSAISDTSPPIYYLLMRPWTKLFGVSEIALRTPSAIFQAFSLILLFLMARRWLQERAALILLIMILLNPLQVDLATDARPYALYQFLIVAFLYISVSMIESETIPKWKSFLAFIIAACAMYVHYMAALFVVAIAFVTSLLKWKRDRKFSLQIILPAAAAILVFCAWLPAIYLQSSKSGRLGYLGKFGLSSIMSVFYWDGPFTILGLGSKKNLLVSVLTGLLWVASIAWSFRKQRQEAKIANRMQYLLGTTVLLFILLGVVCQIRPVYSPKNFPALLILIAAPIAVMLSDTVSHRFGTAARLTRFAPAVILVLLIISQVNFGTIYYKKPSWKEVAEHLKKVENQNSAILIFPQHDRSPFAYYYLGDGYSVDEARASKPLEAGHIYPLYDFDSSQLKNDPTLLSRKYGKSLILLDSSTAEENVWQKSGFVLATTYPGVQVFSSKSNPDH